ncbi:unknown [Blautia sp. CAG:237]|nr:unknown [Blautia sp. CAG:237]
MAVCLQAKLSVIWCPAWITLCFCFQNQVVVIFETADQITTKCDLCTTQVILGRMINIRSCHGQMFCTFKMVYIRLHAVGISSPLKIQIVGDKLVFSLIFRNNRCLPAQEFFHQTSLVFFKLCPQTSIDRTAHIRKIFPGIDAIAPVIQTEFMIHGIQIIMKFLPEIFHKTKLHVFACSSIIFRFIIKLESDHTFSVCRNFHQLADDSFRIIPIDRMCDVHNLSRTIDSSAFDRLRQHIRIGFHHPGRHCIGRSPYDNVNFCLFHRIHYTDHM